MRLRHLLFLISIIIVPLLYMSTDPDTGIIRNLPYGADIVEFIINMSKAFIVITFLFWARMLIHDYPEAKTIKLLREAIKEPQGAGLAIIGLAIFTLAYSIVIAAVLIN